MTRLSKFAVAAAAAAMFLTSAAASAADPDKMATNKVKKMDTDGDGSVSLTEFTTYRTAWIKEKGKDAKMGEPKAIARAFAKIDTNSDGKITVAEFSAQAAAKPAE